MGDRREGPRAPAGGRGADHVLARGAPSVKRPHRVPAPGGPRAPWGSVAVRVGCDRCGAEGRPVLLAAGSVDAGVGAALRSEAAGEGWASVAGVDLCPACA